MIARFTSVEIRHYRDNGQTKVYVSWIDGRGKHGRTEADYPTTNAHTLALIRCAAVRDSIRPTREEW